MRDLPGPLIPVFVDALFAAQEQQPFRTAN
jgi:hypothetical protein